MILLIDNYDSFSYNLYQLIGSINPDIKVIRNDEMTVEEIKEMAPSHIILSPGPGKPSDAGICEEVVRQLAGKIPILGVCLGHQAICEVYGANVTYAKRLMHGKQSICTLEDDDIFDGVGSRAAEIADYGSLIGTSGTIKESGASKNGAAGRTQGNENDKKRKLRVARYHSLAAKEEGFPEELKVIAVADDDGEIMAVRHRDYVVYGLQFHPESILTPEGMMILTNFLR
ncbi:glutamine amidotransferase of anthranilate synthase or aminodeoxychorismate synthase [Eubacterium ruminantium]|nr:glutamine amidotransferase of anthranilate synthase or aminodeoxychorismate synthase [Eubacterium ruminantium]